jgi:hypothetical protein
VLFHQLDKESLQLLLTLGSRKPALQEDSS